MDGANVEIESQRASQINPFLGYTTHSTSTGARGGNWNAYMVHTMTCGSHQRVKLGLYPSQTTLLPVHRLQKDRRRQYSERERDTDQQPSIQCASDGRRLSSDCVIVRSMLKTKKRETARKVAGEESQVSGGLSKVAHFLF